MLAEASDEAGADADEEGADALEADDGDAEADALDGEADEAEELLLEGALEHPTIPMANTAAKTIQSSFLFMVVLPLQSVRLPIEYRQACLPS